MEDTWPAAGNGRCRFSRIDAASSRLHPDELDRRIGDKIIKSPMALLPPPTQAMATSGRRPSFPASAGALPRQ